MKTKKKTKKSTQPETLAQRVEMLERDIKQTRQILDELLNEEPDCDYLAPPDRPITAHEVLDDFEVDEGFTLLQWIYTGWFVARGITARLQVDPAGEMHRTSMDEKLVAAFVMDWNRFRASWKEQEKARKKGEMIPANHLERLARP